ncbi:unnamed protein product [Rhizophagus irregularis]|nr:unnamed protein product [Rhizophagus irregularis]
MLIKQEYIRDDKNQLNSAEVLLNEYGYKTLLNNTKDGVKFLSFTTPFFEKMIETQEIVVDATYKTNVLGYELYAIIGQFDGSGFAMAYLFVEGSKKSDGARTEILTLFFRALYDLGMKNIQFFLTDKDFAQISAAQQIWPHVKIQICLWHIKKALKKRLSDNTQPKIITYSSNSAHEALRSKIIEILEIHMHRHSLIPNINGYHLSAEEIWRESAYKMYEFCFGNDLRNVWVYLWTNWYKKEIWILWARSAIPEKICMFRTTMLSESHWKVIKRDYLPKFFRPRLDLVIYVLLTRLIPHHQQQYNKYLCGREKPSWRKDFKKEWNNLQKKEINNKYFTDTEKWICSCLGFLKNRFFLCKHLINASQFTITPFFFNKVQRQEIYPFIFLSAEESIQNPSSISNKDNVLNNITNLTNNDEYTQLTIVNSISDDDDDQTIQLFKDYKLILHEALRIVEEQENISNKRWAQAVQTSFKGIKNLVTDINKYER